MFEFLGVENKVTTATIFNTMRILKKINRGDTYLENYKGHLQRNPQFFDTYCLLWQIGTWIAPKRILEIGTRTGISLCQLLSSYIDHSMIEEVISIDPYDAFTSPKIVEMNLKYLNIPTDKIKFIVGKSGDEVPKLYGKEIDGTCQPKKTFDYILVDGDHTREVARIDLELCHDLLESGGIVVFDDISPAPGECNLLPVWEEYTAAHLQDFEFTQHNLTGKGVAWAVKK